MKESDAQYWIAQVEKGLEAMQQNRIFIGRALSKLRGNKYKKVAHLWKEDSSRPKHLATFNEYCKWKWDLSETQISRYIRAYELVEDIEEDLPVGQSSPETAEERVLRPLTPLKKEERQRGWEIASKLAQEKNQKITSRHTKRAAMIIRNVNEDLEASRKEFAKKGNAQDRVELELIQSDQLGIAEARAKAKVTTCLEQLFRDENDKAKLYLSRLLMSRLFNIYPQLMDEPIKSFSLVSPQ